MRKVQKAKRNNDETEELDVDEIKGAIAKLSDDDEDDEPLDLVDLNVVEPVEASSATADIETYFYRQLKSDRFHLLSDQELLATARSLLYYKAKVERLIYRVFCELYHGFGPQHDHKTCWVCLTRNKIADKCGERPSGKSLRLWVNEQVHSVNLNALFGIFGLKQAEKIVEILLQGNQRLVYSIARRSKWNLWKKISIVDLVQSGTVGLMHAIAGYNPNLGFRFSTYATWWIRQSIGRDAINNGSMIRLPVHIEDLFSKIHQIARRNQLDVDLDQDKVVQVAAKFLADNPQEIDGWALKIEKVLVVSKFVRNPYSLDLPSPETGDNLHEIVFDPTEPRIDEVFEKENDHGRVLSLIKKRLLEMGDSKGKREWFVLMHRFGLEGVSPKPLWQIAEILELSRERVRQIEQNALNKIKRFVKLTNGE